MDFFFSPFFLFYAAPPPLLSGPKSVCWLCSVWSLPDASGFPRPPVYNKPSPQPHLGEDTQFFSHLLQWLLRPRVPGGSTPHPIASTQGPSLSHRISLSPLDSLSPSLDRSLIIMGFLLSGDLKTGLSVNRPRAPASDQHASLLLPMKISPPMKDWFCEIPFPQPSAGLLDRPLRDYIPPAGLLHHLLVPGAYLKGQQAKRRGRQIPSQESLRHSLVQECKKFPPRFHVGDGLSGTSECVLRAGTQDWLLLPSAIFPFRSLPGPGIFLFP